MNNTPDLQNPKQRKKLENAWAMYDWANSTFSLTIASAIFPAFYNGVTESFSTKNNWVDGNNYYVEFLGKKVINTSLYDFALSFGFLVVAFLSPLLSGLADYSGNKKRFLQLFCYLGAASCASLFFFDPAHLEWSMLCFVLGLVGFSGSLVYYNAFLPEITTEDRYDQVSAKGFSFGYFGSVILLILNLVLITITNTKGADGASIPPIWGGIDNLTAVKLAFLSVGLWWAGFAQITFRNLPPEKPTGLDKSHRFKKGFQELKRVWEQLKYQPWLKRYLVGFFVSSMGLQTIMFVAALFGGKVLNLPQDRLIGTILIIQLIAAGGAYLFSYLSRKLGNIRALQIAIVAFIFVCLIAYRLQSEAQFYGLAVLVGTIMGGSQALFRSTYAKLIPDDTPNHASYFSFYDVCEKLASAAGTLTFGLIETITGDIRISALSLAVFFILGWFLVGTVKNFKEHHGILDNLKN